MHRINAMCAIAAFGAALGIIGVRQASADDPDAMLCYESAWKVESVTVYGDKASLGAKLEKYATAIELPRHRVYLVSIESADGAELTLFEYEKEAKLYSVTTYTADSMSEVLKEVNAAVLASEGKKCVGEITKQTLGKTFANSKKADAKKVPAKESGLNAFKKFIEKAKGDFLRVTVTVLC